MALATEISPLDGSKAATFRVAPRIDQTTEYHIATSQEQEHHAEDFEYMLRAADRSILLTAELKKIAPTIHKYEKALLRYEQAQQTWNEAQASAYPDPSEKIMMYKNGELVEDTTYHAEMCSTIDSKKAKARKAYTAAKSLHTRYTNIVTNEDLYNKQHAYRDALHEANTELDTLLWGKTAHLEDQDVGPALADLMKHTADEKTAPLLIDRMLHVMQARGLYDQIEALEPHIRDFAARSLTAFLPEGKDVSPKLLNRHIVAMLALHAQRYIQGVLLTEGAVDSGSLWQKKAADVRFKDITGVVISQLFDLYHFIGKEINPSYTPTYTQPFTNLRRSPLVMAGGILESTIEFKNETQFKNHKGVYIGHDDIRGIMLLASLVGIPYHILDNHKIELRQYVDPRGNSAIENAKRDIAEKVLEREHMLTDLLSLPKQHRKRQISEATLPSLQTEATVFSAAEDDNTQDIPAEATWLIRMFDHVSRIARAGNKKVHTYIEQIAAAEEGDKGATVDLFEYILSKLPKEDRASFNEVYDAKILLHHYAGVWVHRYKKAGIEQLKRIAPPLPETEGESPRLLLDTILYQSPPLAVVTEVIMNGPFSRNLSSKK